MTKKTKTIITAAALVLIFAGAGVYIAVENNLFAPPIAEPVPLESSSSTADIATSSSISASSEDEDDYVVPPLKAPPKKEQDASSQPLEENKATITSNPDGTTNTQIERPEYSKPEPPPPPVIDEEQASDPTKEPEYTPEQKEPNKPKPDDPETPTGGETNNKGQIYVPGFGWQKPTGGESETVEMNPNGNIIGH